MIGDTSILIITKTSNSPIYFRVLHLWVDKYSTLDEDEDHLALSTGLSLETFWVLLANHLRFPNWTVFSSI